MNEQEKIENVPAAQKPPGSEHGPTPGTLEYRLAQVHKCSEELREERQVSLQLMRTPIGIVPQG